MEKKVMTRRELLDRYERRERYLEDGDVMRLKIESLLNERGIDYRDFAVLLDVSDSQMKKILRNEVMPKTKTLVEIAYELKVEVADLFVRTGWADFAESDEYISCNCAENENIADDFEGDITIFNVREYLDNSDIRRVASCLGCSFRVAGGVFERSYSVSAEKWSKIANALGAKAHRVMHLVEVHTGLDNYRSSIMY